MSTANTIRKTLEDLHRAADERTGTTEGKLLREAARAIGVLHEIVKEARAAVRMGEQRTYRYVGEPNSVTGYEAALRMLEMGDHVPQLLTGKVDEK